jgi:hypothetical protein
MPDDDRMPRSLGGGWRRVLKAIQAREPQEAIAYHVAKATAETLRRTHGIPDLPALSARLHRATVGGSSDHGDDEDGYRALPAHIPTRLARRAVDVLAAVMKDHLALSSPDSAAQMLARRVVADVAYTFGLDRIAPVLVASGYSHSELRRQFEDITLSNPLSELARRLLAHPDATGLRAPGQRRPKLGMADLMDIDIEAV